MVRGDGSSINEGGYSWKWCDVFLTNQGYLDDGMSCLKCSNKRPVNVTGRLFG